MSTFEEQLKDSVAHTYEIDRELGGGGMSRVFVATDRSLGRKIVIKILSPELVAGVNRDRFRREIQVAAALQHPHIVPLLSAGEQGDIVYYTMPFIEGESLKSALEGGPLQIRDVVRVLYDVVDALGYAHARGVVHRDIKPANILRSGQHSLVTDFGVAKALNASMPQQSMTSTGLAIGTPAYMAPEQLAGDPAADHRIDIYAVGLLAYELLSGQSPFVALSPQAVMAALLTVDPKPLNQIRREVPKRLSAIIMQCLAKDPDNRPPSAEALLTGLDTIATASGEIRTREHKVPVTGIVSSSGVITRPVVAAKTGTKPAFIPFSPPDKGRGTRRILIGVAVLILAGFAWLLFSQLSGRGGSKPTAANIQTPKPAIADPAAATSSSGGTVAAASAAVAPTVLKPIDSLAIAQIVAKRMAQAIAAKTPGQAVINTDSIRKRLQRELTDSIRRANAAAVATAAAAAPAPAPAPAAAPVAPTSPTLSARPRLAITEIRGTSDQPVLATFSRSLVDALRGKLGGDSFTLVDQDSVHGAIGRTQTGDELAKIIQPEVMIIPSFGDAGADTVIISVAIRDLRPGSRYGFRVVRMKTNPAYPQYFVGPLVEAVLRQLEPLPRGR